jgi:HK97 family phage portal protein
MGVIASIRSALARTLAPAAAPLSGVSGGGWWPTTVREPYTGAWQQNVEVNQNTVLTYSAVFACVTLIASDIGKLCLRLVKRSEDGVWLEADSPAFSPVLRKANRYQTIAKTVEQWITSKLVWGNAYVLKQRDGRGVVVALYVLDPCRVTPLVAPDGSVYYQLHRNDLAGEAVTGIADTVILPASELIHDTMVCLFHPLVGVSPIYASGLAAMQGLAIQNSATTFFTNGSRPSGLLVVPAGMTAPQLAQAKTDWETFNGPGNAGKVAVIAADIKYTQLTMNAVDAQLIEQLKWSAETVCSCYHVPPYMIGVGPPPPYANVEPLLQQYYSQCIQSLLTNFEKSLDEGLGILEPVGGTQYGTEFDIDDLIWMDTLTKTKAAGDAIGSGGMSPDEARKKYFGLGPVTGGDTPYMQQQMFSLKALAKRDADDPFSKPTPAPVAAPPADELPPGQVAAMARHLLAKALDTRAA